MLRRPLVWVTALGAAALPAGATGAYLAASATEMPPVARSAGCDRIAMLGSARRAPPSSPSALITQGLAVSVVPTGCFQGASSTVLPAPVALVLSVTRRDVTTCETVVRRLGAGRITRTRYCRSNKHRGVWRVRGRATGLPRWAILTDSEQEAALTVRVTSPTTGLPVTGAHIAVTSGLAPATVSNLVTSAAGTALLPLPFGPRRVLTATLTGQPGLLSASASAEVEFPARSTFRLPVRFVAPGGLAPILGSLAGPPWAVGHGSSQVVLEMQRRRMWRTVAHAWTRGLDWAVRLRFGANAVPAALAFRLLILPAPSYPYVAGVIRVFHIYLTRTPSLAALRAATRH
jgi:hypothetical protein